MRRRRPVDPDWDAFWTWRRVAWWRIHRVINVLASTRGPGVPPHRRHWLWRLNDWAARHWTDDYIAWRVGETERGRTYPRQGPR